MNIINQLARVSILSILAVFSATTVSQAANTVVWPARASYHDWNPASTYSEETYVLGNIFETLTFYQDGKVLPRLAESWSASDGNKTWTFKLRKDVKFHDGDVMDAAAVKNSVEWTKKLGKGAAFLWAGLQSTETPDSYTVVFKFKSPIALDLVASGQYGSYIISPKSTAKGHDWLQKGQGAGTGPYTWVSNEKGVQIVLEKFDDYWGGWESGQIDRVIVKTVKEGSTRIQMIKSGEGDLAVIPSDQVKAVDAAKGVSVSQGTGWRNSMFLFNFKKSPTDNAKFREALAHLFDYNSVLNDIMHGVGTAPVGPLPKSMWGHGEYDMPKFDLARVKKLLDDSGVPVSEWKVTVQYIGSVGSYSNSMELFQANAAEVGIEVELLPNEWGVMWGKAKKLETSTNLTSMTWWPAYATPQDWLWAQWRTEKKPLFNLSFYSNPAFDKALDAAVAAEGVDLKDAAVKYIKAQDILMKDTPAIFMSDSDRYYAHSDRLKGMEKQFNPAYETLFFYLLRK